MTAHLSSFPPGRQPDEDPLFYDVPYADPPMNIKFRQYQLIPDRDETRVEDTFRNAVADCIGPGRRTTLMPEKLNYYESGEISLAVQPEEGSESTVAGYAPPSTLSDINRNEATFICTPVLSVFRPLLWSSWTQSKTPFS